MVDNNIYSKSHLPVAPTPYPPWMTKVAYGLIVLVVGFEFFLDLKKYPLLLQVVWAFDALLIIGFVAQVSIEAIRARLHIFEWILKNKVTLIFISGVMLTAYWPRVAAGVVIFRVLMRLIANALDTPIGQWVLKEVNLKPTQTLALSFLGLIFFLTILLTFPAATMDGKGATFIDALFTMTSAVCVTGLVLYETGTYFSPFGLVVIYAGFQIGGMGIMILSVAIAVLLGGALGRTSFGQGAAIEMNSNINTPEGMKQLIAAVSVTVIIAEFLGILFLLLLWRNEFDTFGELLWWSVFHTASAFMQAGFAFSGDSLARWVGDPAVCFVFAALITAGGLGFVVITDLFHNKAWRIFSFGKIWRRLHIQTKIILIGYIILNTVGMLLFLFLEYDGALAGLSIPAKINASIFQAVTLRSAGFATVPQDGLTGPSVLMCITWMFIGAAPGSTGGGVKITTAAVVLMAVRAMLHGRDEVEIFGRRMPRLTVFRSISMVLICGTLVVLFTGILAGTQTLPFDKIFFEVVSALTTNGLSMGVTPELDATGRVVVSFLMYVGRVGPLTLALAVGERVTKRGVHYPEGTLAIG